MKNNLIHTFLFLFLSIVAIQAQDDSDENLESDKAFAKKELQKEQQFLNFEKAFIEAITQRNNEDYDKALEKLAICENIFPDNVAMLFEKAKNHFALKQYVDAIHYSDKALNMEPDNYWILDLLKDTYIKQQNYEEAIVIADKMYKIKEIAAGDLLRLYYYINDAAKAKQLIKEVDKKNIYVTALSFYKRKFSKDVAKNNIKKISSTTNEESIADLQNNFSSNRSYATLMLLLQKEKALGDFMGLLKDSNKGVVLFPAQAKVYYYNGIANMTLKKYTAAVEVLEMGLDYIIDDILLQKDFYKALITAYKGLGNIQKENHYKQMVQKL